MSADRAEDSKRPSSKHLSEARRLIAACGGDARNAVSIADATETVCRQAIDHLGPLISVRAAHALLARAVHLSKPGFAALNTVSTAEATADVARDLPVFLRGRPADEAFDVASAVLGHFVWLLTRFTSDDLGLRLLREACPDGGEEQS
jgi:hypothetical protein